MAGFQGDLKVLVDALPINCHASPDSEACCQAILRDALFTTVRSMGFLFVRFSCWRKEVSSNGEFPDSFSINFSNFPEAWEARYESEAYYLYDPVVEKLAQSANERLVFGTWEDARIESLINPEKNAVKEHKIQNMMDDIGLCGLNSGCFMMYNTGLKRFVMSIASDWSAHRLQEYAADRSVYAMMFSIMSILSNGMALAEQCQHYQMNIRVGGSSPVRLTGRQKEVLQTFLEHAKANNRSVAKMHALSPESISFHLKDIRKRFNKPGASGHALATIAKAHGLI